MWHFIPMPYVIINTGSKYRLTFYVKQRQKKAANRGLPFLYAKIILAICSAKLSYHSLFAYYFLLLLHLLKYSLVSLLYLL